MTKRVSLFLKSILSVAAFLIASVSFAQGNHTVKFKLVDEKTSEPVSFATASLTLKGETKAVKYVLTNDEGVGEIVKVKKGTYKFKAELMVMNITLLPSSVSFLIIWNRPSTSISVRAAVGSSNTSSSAPL